MAKNKFDGYIMNIDFVEKEWDGLHPDSCALCIKKLAYPKNAKERKSNSGPFILTSIEHASLDEYKYFCSDACLERWAEAYISW